MNGHRCRREPLTCRALLATTVITIALTFSACADAEKPVRGADSDHQPAFEIAGRTYCAEDAIRFELPAVLEEISGLTLDDRGYLYGHDDERGVVYQIDYQAGRVTKRFGLRGGPKEDFEGIAWLQDRLFMTTSRGRLYELPPGSADEMVPWTVHTDGLHCEIEGLTRTIDRKALLAACKNRPKGKGALHFHRWQPGQAQWSRDPHIHIKRSAFDPLFEKMAVPRPGKFQPTAITVTPAGSFLFVAGPQKLLLEVSEDGSPLAAARLDPTLHRQPEGIAMTTTGLLIIADEGGRYGTSRGQLSVYRPAAEAALRR